MKRQVAIVARVVNIAWRRSRESRKVAALRPRCRRCRRETRRVAGGRWRLYLGEVDGFGLVGVQQGRAESKRLPNLEGERRRRREAKCNGVERSLMEMDGAIVRRPRVHAKGMLGWRVVGF